MQPWTYVGNAPSCPQIATSRDPPGRHRLVRRRTRPIPIAVDEHLRFRPNLPVVCGLGLLLRQHEVVEDDGAADADGKGLAVGELLLVGRHKVRMERVLPGSIHAGGDPEADHPGQQRVGHGGEDARPQVLGFLVREPK